MSRSRRHLEKRRGGFPVSRRTFIKLSALTGAAVVTSRFVGRSALGSGVAAPETSNDRTITEKWINTSCLNCPARCGTQVRVVDGKAVKIIGNPLSQVAEGKNCARAQVGLQVLYDPDRLAGPVKRTNPQKGSGVDPGWLPLSWDEALSEVSERLKSLRGKSPHQLLVFQGLNTVGDEDLIRRLADAYGTPNVIGADGLDDAAEKAGGWMADGNFSHSAYDLARCNYILAFGASILESEKPLARNLRMWAKIRRERPNRAKVVVIDPRFSVTAAKADQWLPINPGTEGALAMAIANVIISENLYDTNFIKSWTTGFDEYKELVLKSYSPDTVAALTGTKAETIRQLAREFAQTRPAIAWRGKNAVSSPNGAYSSYAVYCLNALVGSIDVPGGVTYQETPDYRPVPPVVEDSSSKEGKAKARIDLARTSHFPAAEVVTNQVADSIIKGQPYAVEMAIGFNSNFNMDAPGTQRWEEALKRLPYYVHVAPFASEMADYADIILPASTFLETWSYDHSPPGSGFAEIKIKQPVVEPWRDTRSIADIIFDIAKRLGGTVTQSFSGIGDNAEGWVKFRTGNLISWDEFKQKGVWVGPAYQYYKYDRVFLTPSKKFEFYSGNLEARFKETGQAANSRLAFLPHYEEVKFLGDQNSYPLQLMPYQPLLKVENGAQNYPWAQEFFLIEHGTGWVNFAEINAATARNLGIRDGDVVWVESPFGRFQAKARVIEWMHPGVVAIATGQGHSYGRWTKGIGVNPNDIIGVDYDRISGQSAFINTRVKVYRV